MKYRSRTDITGLILEAANGGATKTKIMYKAYLSFAQMKEYLSMLIEKGLIQYEEGRASYRTTEKGLMMLQMCNRINDELAISPNQSVPISLLTHDKFPVSMTKSNL